MLVVLGCLVIGLKGSWVVYVVRVCRLVEGLEGGCGLLGSLELFCGLLGFTEVLEAIKQQIRW